MNKPATIDPMSALVAYADGFGSTEPTETDQSRKARDAARRANKRQWAKARRAAYASVGMKRTPYGYE